MRLYLAGGESWADLLLDMGVKHQLLSYYYFRTALRTGKAGGLLARMRKAKAKGYLFMIDSGAFTYQEKGKKGAVPPPDAYFQEYYDFILQHGDLFDVIVEFDIDQAVKVLSGQVVPLESEEGELVTVDQVDQWTNRFLELPAIAPRVMPVYHPHRGKRWLQSWLVDTRSPLVGFASDIVDPGTMGALLAQAHRFGKFAHGFAQTRIRTDLKYTPFDSVDSTTWLRADKFGGTMIFRNNKLIVLDHLHKADRRLYRSWYESWGLDFSLIAKDDLHENRKATIVTWREMGNSFEEKWFFRTNGKYPYLYQMYLEGKPIPDEHPVITKLRRDKSA